MKFDKDRSKPFCRIGLCDKCSVPQRLTDIPMAADYPENGQNALFAKSPRTLTFFGNRVMLVIVAFEMVGPNGQPATAT
jgi:hypothetical protein